MKKEITKENRVKLDSLVSSIEEIENTVPFMMKTVFNFKGRKCPAIAQAAIEALTAKDDVIFDPFMGSGSFVIAAAKAKRKIYATELDNYTYSAVYTLLTKVDFSKLQRLFRQVETEAKASVMALYETRCCGAKNYISKLLYDPAVPEYYHPTPNREIKEGRNVKLASACPVCGKREKQFNDFDYRKILETEALDVSAFPRDHYIVNSRINITASTGADTYDKIFTARNKAALLTLQKAILKLEPSIERDVLEQALVSSLSLARIAMYGSSTDILYHVVPYGAQEMNVWELFENKVKSFVMFKKGYGDVLEEHPEKGEKYFIGHSSYKLFSEKVLKEACDLVYTDFPYTDQVPYLERNQLYRIWLERFYDPQKYKLTEEMLSDEIVLTNAPSRPEKQSLERYYSDLDQMFQVLSRVLKTHHLAVFTVKLGRNKYFTTLMEIINLARKNGFELALRIGIDKNDPSLRKQAAYKNTLSNEMMIVFEKLAEADRYWYVGNRNYEFETVKLVYNLIRENGGRPYGKEITLTSAVRHVLNQLRTEESYLADEGDQQVIQKIIRENFFVDYKTADVYIDSNRLYLDIEDNGDLFSKLYDYVPVIIRRLLEEKERFVLDDLYFEIANTLCNGDPQTINQFLEDPGHQADIMRLVENYCTTTGKEYEKKVYDRAVSDGAVDISTLEGTEFELLVRDLLEAEGFTDVINTGGAGDLGVDLLAKKADQDGKYKKYLFQCKRWAANVGSEPMQRLDSERARRKADVAICVTTSDYTEDGRMVSEKRDIGAWNGEEVIRRLNLYFPGKYYNGMLNK